MKRPLLRLLPAAVLVLAVYLFVRLSVSSNAVPQELGVLELERVRDRAGRADADFLSRNGKRDRGSCHVRSRDGKTR